MQAVQRIVDTWQIDEDRVETVENGFNWWPGSFQVQVRYHDQPGAGPDGDEQARIAIETDYIEDVPVADKKFSRLLAAFGGLVTGYCFWYAPQVLHERLGHEGPVKLTLVSSAYVQRYQLDWLPTFLAEMALLQPIAAEAFAASHATVFGGRPAYAPALRVRQSPDKILMRAKGTYMPAGQKPSWWSDTDEFERFANMFGRQDACFGFGHKDKMTLEAPFGSNSALLRFISSEQHPRLGSGLLVIIQLPFPTAEDDAAQKAAVLNCWEVITSTGFPQLGCWHTDERIGGEFGVNHTTFVPNALARPALAANLAFWSLSRVGWAREILWPDMADLTMKEILSARLGIPRSS
jgi:hypothetical protein